jgi:hypothetical protein
MEGRSCRLLIGLWALLVCTAAVDMSRPQRQSVVVALGYGCVAPCSVSQLLRASGCRQYTHSDNAFSVYADDVPPMLCACFV